MRCKSAENLLQDQLTRLAEVKTLEIQQLKRMFDHDPDTFQLSRRQLWCLVTTLARPGRFGQHNRVTHF
jgi:hypothetical protein